MADVSSELFREAFIDPIRFALLLDDRFPDYPALAGGGFDAKQDNERAKKLFEMCRQRGWLCDVDNRAQVATKFEEEKHLHQSDLLILDFNLDPADPNDPTVALNILQSLQASAHFNLVIVYTATDPKEAIRDIVFSLGGGADLLPEDEKKAEDIFEDLDDPEKLEDSLSWDSIEDYLCGKSPMAKASAAREHLKALAIKSGKDQDLLIKLLVLKRMRNRVRKEVRDQRKLSADVYTSLGQEGVQWAAVVSRMLWKFPGGMLRAWEGSCSQAARSRGIGSMG